MSNKKKSIYIETTIVSYLVSRQSSDIVSRARQELTKRFWNNCMVKYDAYISQYVLTEAQKGDSSQSEKRIKALESFQLLELNDEIESLAKFYFKVLRIPEKSKLDAFHLAVACMHKMDYVVTWNFHHLSNGWTRKQLDVVNRDRNIATPIICSPEEISEAENV